MPRPRKLKIIHGFPIPMDRAIFKPIGIPLRDLEYNVLTVEEFEAIRLIDGENYSQIDAASLMKISQPTISRILNSGRHKIADSLINGKAIRIEGGNFKFKFTGYGCQNCNAEWTIDEKTAYAPERCPKCKSEDIFVLKRE
ncbi:MAG: DUF134 domain-containing protein [Promethearchaeota archaeon]